MGTKKEEEQEEEEISTIVTALQNTADPSAQQRWSEAETICLIRAYRENWLLLKKGQLKSRHWEDVANKVFMYSGGAEPSKSSVQCQHKLEKLRKRYREEKQIEEERGGAGHTSTWPYYSLMDDLEEGGGQNKKRSAVSSQAGDRAPDKVTMVANRVPEKIVAGNRVHEKAMAGSRIPDRSAAAKNRAAERNTSSGNRPAEVKTPALKSSGTANFHSPKTMPANGRPPSQTPRGVKWKSEEDFGPAPARDHPMAVRFKDDYEEEEEEEDDDDDDDDDDYDGRDSAPKSRKKASRSKGRKGAGTTGRAPPPPPPLPPPRSDPSLHGNPTARPKVFKSNGKGDAYDGEEIRGPKFFKGYEEHAVGDAEENARPRVFRSYGNEYGYYGGEDALEDGMFAERVNMELASVVRSIGEGFLRVEQMKLEMHRDNERLRAEVELKRTSMLLDSQKQISEMLTRALVGGKKGIKKRQLQEL